MNKIGNKNIIKKMFGNKEIIKEVFNGSVIYEKVIGGNYITFSSSASFTLKVVDSTKYWDGTLEYSTDATTWNVWDGTTTLSSGSDNKLYLRGTGNTIITGSSAGNSKAHWSLTGNNVSCEGNIENLLDYQTVANGEHPTMANNCYSCMFQSCTSLLSSPSLPATTLASGCYSHMFRYCTSLTTAPALPATTLVASCYYGMFLGCTSLTTAPSLPATTLRYYCYENMFYNCSSLYVSDTQTTSAPYAWRIPTNGTFTNTITQSDMFINCLGTRASNSMAGASGQSYTYYTQNQPVGE